MDSTAKGRFEVARMYRDIFGISLPEVENILAEKLYDLALKAMMRGTPITEDELQEGLHLGVK
ncbi:hypothetical protein H4684_004062 [Desulfomicrobium macestii]|uniref:Uncharacterized protein n=1 Tax=Desulfomicrobium macestii TaxID=90731 RepID=A0ABR9H9J9_9BACT|nr:hypothetical protein [Desulfomicrobium macestii]MBE1427368.1 hypothetical protein [Desulfomicrobium macestii]